MPDKIKTSLRDMEVGDIIITDEYGSKKKILAICDQVFLPSVTNNFNSTVHWYTFTEAENYGWRLKDQVDPEPELTPEPRKRLYTSYGALLTAPERYEEIWVVRINLGEFECIAFNFIDDQSAPVNNLFRAGRAFDSQKKAEKYATFLNDRNLIRMAVERKNAEQGWVADWSDRNQGKYYLNFDHDEQKFYLSTSYEYQSSQFYMSDQTVLWLIETDKFNFEQKKHFCGVLD